MTHIRITMPRKYLREAVDPGSPSLTRAYTSKLLAEATHGFPNAKPVEEILAYASECVRVFGQAEFDMQPLQFARFIAIWADAGEGADPKDLNVREVETNQPQRQLERAEALRVCVEADGGYKVPAKFIMRGLYNAGLVLRKGDKRGARPSPVPLQLF